MDLPLPVVALKYAMREHERGVSETDGPNDSPAIREYLAAAGIHNPAPWCAALVQWAADRAAMLKAIDNPLREVKHEAYVPSYVHWAQTRGKVVKASDVGLGDIFCLWHAGKQRYAHMGLVRAPPFETDSYRSIEGNSNADGSREGTRIVSKTRDVTDGTLFIRWSED